VTAVFQAGVDPPHLTREEAGTIVDEEDLQRDPVLLGILENHRNLLAIASRPVMFLPPTPVRVIAGETDH